MTGDEARDEAARGEAERPERQKPAATPVVPPDALLVCAFVLDVGLADIDEEAWLARAEGIDELWLRSVYRTRKAASSPSAGDPAAAARRLLEASIRGGWAFEYPKTPLRPGLVSKEELDRILATIRADHERHDAEARTRESRIVDVARELGLGPVPTGTGPAHWQARCPGTNHPLYLQSATGTFGCGWCKRKGGETELRAFAAERRSGKQG